jgi:hypothetical protein
MVTKRGTKAVKRGKKVKDLRVKGMTSRQAKGVKGGGIEITDYGFGVSMPVPTSRSDGRSTTQKK